MMPEPPIDTIIHADCMDPERGLPSLPDGCIDAVITDPPYANATQYAGYEDTVSSLKRIAPRITNECLRVADGVVAITCGVANIAYYPKPTWILCWAQPGGAGSGSSPWGFASWQPILVYGADPYLAAGLGRRPDTTTAMYIRESDVSHPCPKPLGLIRWLLDRIILSTGTVLDPFIGSGTTAVACVQTGRHFIGYEINEGYCEIARQRVAEAEAQPRLLEPERTESLQETLIGGEDD